MIYGSENFYLDAPFSLLISLILFFGVIFIGDFFQKILINRINSYRFIKYNIFFSPIIGIYFLVFPLYIFLIFEIYPIFFIKFFSYSIFVFGVVNIYLNRKIYLELTKRFKFNQSAETHVIVLLFLLLFLVSASPITHADSLDYHLNGALSFLNYGHFQKELLPMHSVLASLGEIPLSLGLFLGGEQFGAIIQYSSLFSLVPIFFKKGKKLFLIAILACPITLFLVSSPKPQLLFCITTLLIFIFLIENFIKLKSKDIILVYLIVLLLLSIIIIAKYSFILSSSLLIIYSYLILLRKKIIFTPIAFGLSIFTITILPYIYFRFQNFDTGPINFFLSPLPLNVHGYESMHKLLSGGSIDIIKVIFIKNLGDFSSTYGPLFVILFFLINKKTLKFKFPLIIIISFLLLVLIFGSNLNRFLYEGYLWLIFLISLTYSEKSIIYKLFSKLVLIQSFIIILICLFYVSIMFPGSLNKNLKEKVMIDHADGYELAKWTNKKLKKEDILISSHRSISLFDVKTYSSFFTWHINPKDKQSLRYANYLKSKKINKILFYGNEPNQLEFEIFKNCLGKKLFYKENVGRQVGRNPFTEGKYYNAWIYEFKNEYLPDCLVK